MLEGHKGADCNQENSGKIKLKLASPGLAYITDLEAKYTLP